jgi:hypothetical protein
MKTISLFIVGVLFSGCSGPRARRDDPATPVSPKTSIMPGYPGGVPAQNDVVEEILKNSPDNRRRKNLPEPSSALARSIFFPSGGYSYLRDHDGGNPFDTFKGILSLVGFGGGIALSGIGAKDNNPGLCVSGIIVAYIIHGLELIDVSDEAARRRDKFGGK